MPRISADVRRELLVDAAIKVMCRDGVSSATTRAIVAEADMRLGAFHYCFRSKGELFEQVIYAINSHTIDLALEAFAQGGQPEDQLVGGFHAYWQHVVDVPGEHRVTYELTNFAQHDPELAEVARAQYDHYTGSLARLFETFASRNDLAWTVPVPVLVRYVQGILDGLTLLYLNEGDAALAWSALELAARHLFSLTVPQ